MRTFDIAAAPATELAQRAAIGVAGDAGRRQVMTLSPDEQTLFIAGSDLLLVEPIP